MPSGAAARDWLTLARTPGLGPRGGARLLVRHEGDATRAVTAGRQAWQDAGLSRAGCDWLTRPDTGLLDDDQAWLERDGHHLITANDPHYPAALRDLNDAPPWLFAVGDTDLLAAPGFAVVGSRNPSRDGAEHAHDFARELAGAGLAVVSGLADGVDAAAHAGALDAGGMTVAVCGTGLDRVYPARNRDLARRIAESGLLVSEFPLGTPARRVHFPRRNRIIAGLSVGILVAEAARNSGSLITARLALEAGREVFALPGSIHNPLARGCHRLIREGARLVESISDIFEEIGSRLPHTPNTAEAGPTTRSTDEPHDLEAEHYRLLECLGDRPLTVDQLVACSGLTADAVSSMLLILELQGLVAPGPGGVFTRNR